MRNKTICSKVSRDNFLKDFFHSSVYKKGKDGNVLPDVSQALSVGYSMVLINAILTAHKLFTAT